MLPGAGPSSRAPDLGVTWAPARRVGDRRQVSGVVAIRHRPVGGGRSDTGARRHDMHRTKRRAASVANTCGSPGGRPCRHCGIGAEGPADGPLDGSRGAPCLKPRESSRVADRTGSGRAVPTAARCRPASCARSLGDTPSTATPTWRQRGEVGDSATRPASGTGVFRYAAHVPRQRCPWLLRFVQRGTRSPQARSVARSAVRTKVTS